MALGHELWFVVRWSERRGSFPRLVFASGIGFPRRVWRSQVGGQFVVPLRSAQLCYFLAARPAAGKQLLKSNGIFWDLMKFTQSGW
jgi:hypothetical protein